jgi:GR25 family glycosyltransferase involved in LPS biosynthesis
MTIEINQKLNNFPPVYYITLEDCVERQNNMERQYQKLGIVDYTKIVAYDGRVVNYCDDSKICGPHLNCIDSGHIATILTHLKAIKYWYENSTSPYAIFMEDDMILETVNFWNFTWDDITTRLPKEWECIQLSLIRGDDAAVPLGEHDIQFRRRSFYNWSAGCYMIKRSHAKKILYHYIRYGGEYNLTVCDYSEYIPYIENIVYIAARPYEFTLPLFVEDVSLD